MIYRINDTVDSYILAAKQLSDWGENPLHLVTPAIIHIQKDRAIVESACMIQLRLKECGQEYDLTSHVRLVYTVERSQSSAPWKILSLGTIYERDSLAPASPTVHPSVTLSTNTDSPPRRNSYKNLWWLLEQRGFEIKPDLPGTDLPETVDGVMSRLFQWLRS
jgi:hypothetical protein